MLVDAGSRREEAFGTEVDMREALERYAAWASYGRVFVEFWAGCLEVLVPRVVPTMCY